VADKGVGHTEIVLQLPPWLQAIRERQEGVLASTDARMEFAIELARRNIEHRTGGPFGAAVFDAASGKLVSVGVNLVEASNCSLAHAEMIAIGLAQQTAGHYDLGAAGVYELVTSVEPCAMCLGAIPWSGLRRVVCGACGEDAAAIGFDEGAKPVDWPGELRKRGIAVIRDVRRPEARAVLQQYAQTGGLLYNPGQGS
jgi:tRNA(Arg) A34 adenosine deaminase TadA